MYCRSCCRGLLRHDPCRGSHAFEYMYDSEAGLVHRETCHGRPPPVQAREEGEQGRRPRLPGIGNFPGWISGQLDLPPTGIKDAESVGLCSQVFNVASCQPKALEFALADPDESDAQFLPETAQRFLLSPGDMFCVPAGNMYRIENHSKTHECKLFWTIIRPAPGDA